MTYFRRSHFPMAPNRQPLWHIIDTAERGLLTALCGYSYDFSILRDPMVREQVKTAKLRCSKCEAKALVKS